MTSPLSYADAVEALTSRGRFGISLGLDRVAAILGRLDHPERSLHGALVGGTNGKGSVVALVRSALNAAGLRVGTMPKPHLVSYRERIAIDGKPVDEARFAAAVAAVLPATDAVARTLGAPTEFEVLTAAALAELVRSQVDLAVVEVGMGGRLDATNVLDPGVAAITNVAHDHERYLGQTLAAIGREKAAIIKPGTLAVTGATGRGLAPILERCRDVGAPLRRAGARRAYAVQPVASGWDGLLAEARAGDIRLRDLRVGLLGSHQAANAGVALAVLDALREDGERRGRPLSGLDEGAIRRGFADARWPGRLELLGSTPYGPVLLDGAHNPAAARALAQALRELGMRRFPMVFGAMRGKRVTAVLRTLRGLEPQAVFTRVQDAAALDPAGLATTWRGLDGKAATATDPLQALEIAADRRTSDQPILVTGSLYLVGAVRGMLVPMESEG